MLLGLDSRSARIVNRLYGLLNLLIVLQIFLIRPFVIQNFTVTSNSMRPTLNAKDVIFVDKFRYRLNEPKRDDVVVLKSPIEPAFGDENKFLVKRLVALPGDTIEVKGLRLFVDGKPFKTNSLESIEHFLRRKLKISEMSRLDLIDSDIFVDHKRVPIEDVRLILNCKSFRFEGGFIVVNGLKQSTRFSTEVPERDVSSRRIPTNEYFVIGDNINRSFDSRLWGSVPGDSIVGPILFR